MEVANQNLTTVKLHPLPPMLSLLLYMLLLHLCLCWFAILESIIRLMNGDGEDVQGGAKCKEGASVAVLKEMPNMGSITTLS
jgi:hypothetical protein